MGLTSLLFKRTLSTQKLSIGQAFMQEEVQKLLKDITRFEEKKIFTPRPVRRLRSPKLMFMTDEQLEKARISAYEEVKARLQMPPVMEADNSEPTILCRDEEIVGYTKHRVMFVDITPGFSDRNRLMSVREVDGTLRYPTHSERSRLNHIFYPGEFRSIDPPKLFEEKNLLQLLKRKQFVYILNRACTEFEPDDPRYVDITSKVYEYIDINNQFNCLRSTRHFGPMSLYLAYHKRADNLILEMLSKNLIEDAVKLVKIYNTCHNIISSENQDDLTTLKEFANKSAKRYNLDLAIQQIESKRNKTKPDPKSDDNDSTT